MGVTVLDAGVVIALGDTTDAHHAACQVAVRKVRAAGERLLLPASAFAEVLVGPVRAAGKEGGTTRVRRLLELLVVEVVPLDDEVAETAASLRAEHGKRIPLPDALVVATASQHRGQVLTTDAGWPAIPQVPVLVVGGRAKGRSAQSVARTGVRPRGGSPP
jgi:predicted nucleic acid-binding protein